MAAPGAPLLTAPARERADLGAQFLAASLLALLLALLVWPIVSVVRAGFVDDQGATLLYFRNVFASDYLVRGFVNSFRLALCVTAGCALIALPLAWVMTTCEFPLKRLLTALVLAPMILPPFVGALGLRRLLAPSGGPLVLILQKIGLIAPGATPDLLAASPFWCTVILIILALYPILFLNVQAALANIDPALEEAAQNLGAGRLRVFFRVTLPLVRPGLFAGATIVFIWSFTELGTPLLVGFRDVAAVQVFDGLAQIEANPQPYAQVVVLLGASILAYLAGKFLLGRGAPATAGKATVARNTRRLGGLRGALVTGAITALVMLAALPHLGVILLALADRWQGSILPQEWTARFLSQVLAHRVTGPSIVNSLKYAGLATALDLALGVALGWVVVRSRVRWRGAFDSLAMLPLAVPGLVMAFGYLSITRRSSPLAFLNPDQGNPLALLVIAYAVRRLPYVVRSVAAGLEQTSVTLEEAAQNLGASRLTTLRRVTLPLIAANLIAGGLLAFSFAMLEVSDSLILAFNQRDYPITKAIYQLGLRLGDGSQMACALGVLGMALLGLTLLGATRLLGKKMGALFRA